MHESLHIENFAGMREVHLDIGKITVLIGPQSTGKSVCAKLLYFFKSIPHELAKVAEEGGDWEEFGQHLTERFESFFPLDSLAEGPFKVEYKQGKSNVSIEREKSSEHVGIECAASLKTRFQVLRQIHDSNFLQTALDSSSAPPGAQLSKEFLDSFQADYGIPAGFKQVFIPAGRSFFAHLHTRIFSLLSNRETIDPFLVEFGAFYETIKDSRFPAQDGGAELESRVDALATSILLGKYQVRNGRDYLQLDDERMIAVENASSGQQEVLPLALVLRTLARVGSVRGVSLYIEEPEAHLFPAAQRDVVELISTIFNALSNKIQVIVTTHSPYILTSFNILIQAGALRKSLPKHKLPQLFETVQESSILEPAALKAYALKSGTQQSLIDPETGLIAADLIDSVSDDLAVDFEKLLEVE